MTWFCFQKELRKQTEKRFGQGTYTTSSGEKYIGEFKDEEPWNVTQYDKRGNILYKYVKGKEIEQ